MKRTAILIGMAVLASCTPMDAGDRSATALADDVRATGEAENCVSVSRIRATNVLGDGVIDFDIGGKTYRNQLAGGCPVLQSGDPITYDVRGGNLCKGELIYRLDRYGDRLDRGPACGLGAFTPIEYVDPVSDGPMIMEK